MSIEVKRIINENTDYEFSVSESIADLITHGKFTENELSSYMTCGYIDNRVQSIVTPNLSLSQMGDYIDSCMFVPSAVTGFSADYAWNKQFPSNFQYYKRNLIVYSEAGINNGQFLSDQDYTKWYIVLDINIKKFYLKDNFRTTDTVAGFTYTDSNGESIEIYGSYNNTEYQCLWQDNDTATTLFVIGLSIINGKMYFHMDNPHNQAFPKPLNNCAIWYDGGIKGGTGAEFITDINGSNALSFMPVLDGLPDYTNGQDNQTPSQEYISGYTNSNGELFGINKSGRGIAYYDATSISIRDNQIGARITKGMRLADIFSWAGFKFKFKNTLYKPIINGGIVTGYTDDMTVPSEWDDMTNVTGNTVPIAPPTPPTPPNDDIEVDMPLAYIGGTGGFVQFIKINSAGLASADDISAALSRFDITTIGKDLLRNFVSYKCFAVLNIDPNDTVTRQITVDGHGLTDENNNPLQGQVIGGVLPIDFEIGTPTPYYNDFRDYAPYTKIEAYVPFCGWFTLPSWCIGKNITGTMFTDLYNGTVKAIIKASQTVVAEVGGCCAYDIPFVADATGAKAGAVISSALSTAAAAAATVTMPNVATGIAAVTSAANTICAVNSNDTTLKGVLGDGSNLNGLLHCYLKITRPQSPTRTNEIPNAYKHEFGIPTYKELTLATGDGYTQIMDAKIVGDMTDREKQMIIDGFRHGLIL